MAASISRVDRLADDFAFEFQRRIGREDRIRQQSSSLDDGPAVLGFGARDTLNIVDRRFVAMWRLVEFLVFTW